MRFTFIKGEAREITSLVLEKKNAERINTSKRKKRKDIQIYFWNLVRNRKQSIMNECNYKTNRG